MNSKRLTPYLLDEFIIYLKNINAKINILDDFLFNLSTLIDLRENMHSSERMEKIYKSADLRSVEDLSRFYNKYFEYTNSIVAFIEHLEKIKSAETIEELSIELFFKFSSYYDEDYEIIMPIIQSNGESLVNIVVEKYHIDYSGDFENLKKSISDKLGEPQSLFISSLIILLEKAKIDKESHDEYLTEMLFRLLIILVFNMNILRKAELSEANIVKKEYSRVNRNAPCPCGSGLKYKKCCLLKIN
jgi:hypothetical protein